MASKKKAKTVGLAVAIIMAITGLVGGYVLGVFFPAFGEGSFLGATKRPGGGSQRPGENNHRN